MELIIIIIVAIISIVIISILMLSNIKEMEKIATDKELNIISEKYPSNIEICKEILNKLNNSNVKIEENDKSDATMYIAISNKILIGNTYKSFTRIQTMIHECLHSIQKRSLLIFNFIYSNIYLLYFIIICILAILNRLPNPILFSNILLILSFIYYVVKIYLENDAMIKAEFITIDYIKEKKVVSNEEIKKIENGIKKINEGGIKGTNCQIFVEIMIKVIIFNVLALIF